MKDDLLMLDRIMLSATLVSLILLIIGIVKECSTKDNGAILIAASAMIFGCFFIVWFSKRILKK